VRCLLLAAGESIIHGREGYGQGIRRKQPDNGFVLKGARKRGGILSP